VTDMGYPLHLIDLLAKLYRKQLTKVKVAGTLSEWFRVKKGVRQGCVLSPYLFNILAEMVMRETLAVDEVLRRRAINKSVFINSIESGNLFACAQQYAAVALTDLLLLIKHFY